MLIIQNTTVYIGKVNRSVSMSRNRLNTTILRLWTFSVGIASTWMLSSVGSKFWCLAWNKPSISSLTWTWKMKKVPWLTWLRTVTKTQRKSKRFSLVFIFLERCKSFQWKKWIKTSKIRLTTKQLKTTILKRLCRKDFHCMIKSQGKIYHKPMRMTVTKKAARKNLKKKNKRRSLGGMCCTKTWIKKNENKK